jgi:23S rRNA pseudouridine955/2504/2580 synthase
MTKNNQERKKIQVRYIRVSSGEEGQRIDNFLINQLKSVPKSHIYRLIRKGEVRVNMKRISPFYKLLLEDQVRLPPVIVADQGNRENKAPPSQTTIKMLTSRILYEDEHLLILNKPSGMSVHAGSTVRMGVIEALRFAYPKLPQLELAHRLDTETSGCLILAKKKRILREIHALLREGKVTKIYWALTQGKWAPDECTVETPLARDYKPTGKYLVTPAKDGKFALTKFKPIQVFSRAALSATLVEARLYTGRTHQIRVHAQHQGHPIAGDDRYGEADFNRLARQHGLKRLFLHAYSIDFTLPSLEQRIRVTAPLDADLTDSLDRLAAFDQESEVI